MKVLLIIILVLAAGVFYSLKIAPKKKEEEEAEIAKRMQENSINFRVLFSRFVKALQIICENLDCPAHFAFYPSYVEETYETYELKIISGEINIFSDDYGMLKYILTSDKEKRKELLMNRFGMSGEVADMIDLAGQCNFSFNDTRDTVEFETDALTPRMKSGTYQRQYMKALGRAIHEEVPEAAITTEYNMVFIMLNGNKKAFLEEKI